MKPNLLIIALLLTALSVSCGHKEMPRRDPAPVQPEKPGETSPGQDRPGHGPVDLTDELTDNSHRFIYGNIALRYDDGGILFTRRPDGSTVITDLDGVDRVTLSPGTMQGDSTFSQPRLTVRGSEVSMLSLSLLKRDDKATWYRAVFPDSTSTIIVLPTDI